MPTIHAMKVGRKVRELRNKNFLTQEELAEKAGISTRQLSRIERGLGNPHVRTIRRLAAALGVEPAELVEEYPEE